MTQDRYRLQKIGRWAQDPKRAMYSLTIDMGRNYATMDVVGMCVQGSVLGFMFIDNVAHNYNFRAQRFMQWLDNRNIVYRVMRDPKPKGAKLSTLWVIPVGYKVNTEHYAAARKALMDMEHAMLFGIPASQRTVKQTEGVGTWYGPNKQQNVPMDTTQTEFAGAPQSFTYDNGVAIHTAIVEHSKKHGWRPMSWEEFQDTWDRIHKTAKQE